MNHITYVFYSIAVPRVLLDLGIEKNIQSSFAFPLSCCDFYRLLIATFVNHWVPRMLFVCLIN